MATRFKDITVGSTDDIIVLINEVTEKTAKNGAYLDVTITDRKDDLGNNEKISARIWQTTKDMFWPQAGDVIKVKLEAATYNGAVQYTIRDYQIQEEISDKSNYLVSAPYAGELMYDNILKLLHQLPECPLVEIADKIYETNKEKLLGHSAAFAVHHNYAGGLLYHTVRMVSTAKRMSEIYPSLDKTLLMVGAALHDIGKLQELDTNPLGEACYTPDGILFGHLLLGDEMILKTAMSLGYDEREDVRLLRHMIASHHGRPEWGAVARPAIAEALVLHEIDMIDSRMEMFERETVKVDEGAVGEKVFGLETRVYHRTSANKGETA